MSRQKKNRPHSSQSRWNHQQVLARIGSSHMTSPAAICKGFVTASLLKSYGHQIKSLCFITQLSLHAMSYINSKFLGNML